MLLFLIQMIQLWRSRHLTRMPAVWGHGSGSVGLGADPEPTAGEISPRWLGTSKNEEPVGFKGKLWDDLRHVLSLWIFNVNFELIF